MAVATSGPSCAATSMKLLSHWHLKTLRMLIIPVLCLATHSFLTDIDAVATVRHQPTKPVFGHNAQGTGETISKTHTTDIDAKVRLGFSKRACLLFGSVVISD